MKNSHGTLTTSHHVNLARAFADTFADTPTYAYYAKSSPWIKTALIDNIVQTNPIKITSYSHGFKNGDIVGISGVVGMTQVNALDGNQIVINVTTDTFELYGVNATTYSTYISGGTISNSLETSVQAPFFSDLDESSHRTEILFMKRINQSMTRLMVPFIPWERNRKFDAVDTTIVYGRTFYCVNQNGEVYVCLNNSNFRLSTVEPNNAAFRMFTLTDGYTWKYLLTLSPDDLATAKASGWMTVNTLLFDNQTPQWLVQQSAVPGRVNNVKVDDGGYGYRVGDQLTLIGDGSGFNGRVQTIAGDGSITQIEVLSGGSRYTHGRVKIQTAGGRGAVLQPVITTTRGIGADPQQDLGARYVGVTAEFVGNEGGKASTSNTIRRMGIMRGVKTTDGKLATATSYDLRTVITATSNSSALPSEGYVSSDTFAAYILSATGTPLNHTIHLSETSNITVGSSFSIGTYSGTVTGITRPSIDLLSGDVIYTENRLPISRSQTGREEFEVIFAF